MEKNRPILQILSGTLLVFVGIFLFACKKEPGHLLKPVSVKNTGITGSVNPNLGNGPVAVGAPNTIIFQYNNTTYIWASPGYYIGLNSLAVFMSAGKKYSTIISAFDATFTSSITFGYDDTVRGTYRMSIFALSLPGIDAKQTGSTSTLYTRVISEGIHVSNTISNTATGTVAGTFDGYVTNINSTIKDSVKVSGSFNIAQ